MSVKTNERMNIQRQTCPRSWVNWGSLLSSTRFNQVISRIHFFGLGSTAFKSNAAPPVNQKQEKKEKKKKTVIINRLKASKRFKMTLAFVVSFFLISLFALRWSCLKYDKNGHYTFLGNCPPTLPLSQHFALSEKCLCWLRGGVGGQFPRNVYIKTP